MSDDIDYRADELANAVIGMQKMINVKGAEIAALKEKVREWLATNLIIYCAECGLEIEDIDWDELDMLLGGEK